MKRLNTLLSDSSKARRNRRNSLNIQIAFLAWLVEFLGFFLTVLGSHILGHKDSVVTMIMQILSMIIFMIILPCIILINSEYVKTEIVESNWYLSFLALVRCQATKRLANGEARCSNANDTGDVSVIVNN